MGKDALYLAALCWMTLGVSIVGVVLRGFQITRRLGSAINWLAVAMFLLAMLGTLAILADTVINYPVIALVLLGVMGLPLALCAMHFYKLLRHRRERARAKTVAPTKPEARP